MATVANGIVLENKPCRIAEAPSDILYLIQKPGCVGEELMTEKKGKIKISENGPYLVSGNLPLEKEIMVVGGENEPERWKRGARYPQKDNYALCRCGHSANKPFCDGTHIGTKFDDGDDSLKKS